LAAIKPYAPETKRKRIENQFVGSVALKKCKVRYFA